MRRAVLLFLIANVVCCSLAYSARAAIITVVNLDSAGEGFNDPSAPDPASAVGGNTGATLGAQRLIAFQHAANIWANLLSSPVEIRVDANFDSLFCDATSAVLGATGPTTAHRDFVGAPQPITWYPQALANSLAATDLDPGNSDIASRFNSSIGTTCAFPMGWYYGLDGSPAAGTIDFVTVVLHELGHGLGFLTFVDLATGVRPSGLNDTYMLNLENHTTGKGYQQMTNAERVNASVNTGNLHWVGQNVDASSGILISGVHPTGHVEMYAPNPQEPGSSVSHFSDALAPDQLMEPFYTGPNHDVGLALQALGDMGWSLATAPLILPLAINASVLLAGEVSVPYSADLEISGGVLPYAIQVVRGGIPEELFFDAAILQGTPTRSGNAKFTIMVSDQVGASVTKAFSLRILKPLTIATNGLKAGRLGRGYKAALKAVGGIKPYSWSLIAGTLPEGLDFDTMAGRIIGTPISNGSFDLTVQLTDPLGGTVEKTLTLTVN
jgi:hypothetical protein